ncbi:hypothetical protein EDC96DRAFT_541943 [Choanephora cucurbitarum]|nr:hypothetical protein EDC96DRAFT_541943 [Choanephora cucurbitarum]
MQRLWQRLCVAPSICKYCVTISKSPLPLPSFLSLRSSTTSLFRPTRSLSSIAIPATTNERLKSKASLMANFYRALATQDIDRIWPLYTYLYNNDLLSHISKRNYHQIFSYTTRSRGCSKNLHRLLAIVEDRRRRGYSLRLSEYNALIHWVGGKAVPELHTHHLLDALDVFDLMQRSSWVDEKTGQTWPQEPVAPCLVTFNSLIHIAAELSDLRTAQKLYHDMISRGIQPDAFTYATLLHAMGKMNDLNGIDFIVKDIKQKRLQNTVISNVLMSVYGTHGHRQKAYGLFRKMLKAPAKGPDRVNAESFRIYMELLIQEKRRSDAVRLLFLMQPQHKVMPITAIYNSLFASFSQGNKNQLDLLKRIYQHMKDSQVKPNSDTMYTLVSAFLDLGDTKSGLEAFVALSQGGSESTLSDIKFTTVATLAQQRLLLSNNSPSKIEPNVELLERLNKIVVDQSKSSI